MKKLAALILMLAVFGGVAHAQAVVQLSPDPKYQFFDDNGDPLAGGKVCTYTTLTNTPLATYTDYTGMTQNTNPVVLDIAGRANIWWDTTKVYRVVLREAGTTSDCTTGTVLWTVDGVAAKGVTSVGNLSPIFTSSVTGGAITFTLSNAAAHTLLVNNTGGAAPPAYGAIGSDTQVAYNCSGGECGSADLTWNNTTDVFTVGFHGMGPQIRLTGDGSGGKIQFGSGTDPSISFATDWFFTASNGIAINIGHRSEQKDLVLTSTQGMITLGTGAANATIGLNNGNNSAGVFTGLNVIGGHLATPETFISAPTGSMYLTTNGGAMATLWVKESSPTASTGWVAK